MIAAYMGYLRFAYQHRRPLAFGFLLTTFSGLGQTFFVSLFVPDLLATFKLSNAQFGTLYSSATLVSALCLPWVGLYVDRWPLKRYTLCVALGLALSAIFLATSTSALFMWLGLWGIRMTGQGLCTHISGTSMARTFGAARGKALSLAGIGYPFAEAMFPLTVTLLIASVGWRTSWYLVAAFVGVVLCPCVLLLLRQEFPNVKTEDSKKSSVEAVPQKQWTRSDVLHDKRFYLLAPSLVSPPLLLTALFLYQGTVAEWRGWTLEWMATAFMAFATARFISGLLVGPLVDRWKATTLFPWYQAPLLLGVLTLLLSDHPAAAVLYLGFAGTTVGIGGNIKSAMTAELYGTQHLGAIRSMASMIVVFSTALGPILFGFLLDAGIEMMEILIASAASIIIVSAAGVLALLLYAKEKQSPPENSILPRKSA